MTASTLSRIMDETSAKLAVARPGDETLAIGVEHMRKVGANAAERVFTSFRSEPLTNEQVNIGILNALGDLTRSIAESFKAFGVTEGQFLDQCLEAATSGFLDRGEALFSIETTGGRA